MFTALLILAIVFCLWAMSIGDWLVVLIGFLLGAGNTWTLISHLRGDHHPISYLWFLIPTMLYQVGVWKILSGRGEENYRFLLGCLVVAEVVLLALI